MPRVLRENDLTVVMFGLFAICLIGQGIAGFRVYNDHQIATARATVDGLGYLRTGHFIEAVFENWESEFLQMGSLVLLTVFLIQKHSPVSRNVDEPNEIDAGSRGRDDAPWPVRRGGIMLWVYAHSLSIALFGLFFLTVVLHAVGGSRDETAERLHVGQPAVSVWSYLVSARFWFESLQNWQSEFLSVGVLVVLSIFLRERGSPESLPIDPPHRESAIPSSGSR